jgi:hypothetical protein
MPKKQINIGHSDHGRGGKTGHQSIETQARGDREARINDIIKRKQEKTQRQFRARVEREIQDIVKQGEREIVPIANMAFSHVKKQIHDRKKYALFMLAIDEFVFRKMTQLFNENKFIAPHLSADFWTIEIKDKYGWLEPKQKTELYSLLLGTKLTLKRQQRLIRDIKAQSKNVERWAVGRMT